MTPEEIAEKEKLEAEAAARAAQEAEEKAKKEKEEADAAEAAARAAQNDPWAASKAAHAERGFEWRGDGWAPKRSA